MSSADTAELEVQGLGRTQWAKCLLHKHEELSSIASAHTRSHVWWHMLVVSALGGQEDPWDFLASQLSLLCKFWAKRPCLKLKASEK